MLLASRFKRFLASIMDAMLITALMIFVTIVIYKFFKIPPPLFSLKFIESLVFYCIWNYNPVLRIIRIL